MATLRTETVNPQKSLQNVPEEQVIDFHKQKSQHSTHRIIKRRQWKITYVSAPTTSSNEDRTKEPIIKSISSSIRSSRHILMDDATSFAARNYYQRIVNDDRTCYDMKRLKIYLDLVLGSKAQLNTASSKLEHHSDFTLNYKIGMQSEQIHTAQGCALTVGRYKENDICTGYNDLTVSRIQCFILLIEDSLIILDGWSYFGTKVMQINGQKNNLQHSMPNKRFVLRFNKNDTVHLRFGETNVDFIINPKPCVVCLDKSRTIRNKCGHLALCRDCYDAISSEHKSKAICPICRAPLSRNVKKFYHRFNDEDMIQSYCKPSHLL